MAEIDDMRAEVARQGTVIAGATTLITGLHDQLAAAIANNDMKAVAEITGTIKTNTDALAAAVAANTAAAQEAPQAQVAG